MANEDGTIWTAFNGEIYNHRELRRSLEGRGHRFRGHSDTEVLVHLYEEEGSAFVGKLRGMFALAIYDQKAKNLLLARDRFGIKPLYYAKADNRLMFASEIGALLELPQIDTQPDRQAISDLAALCYIPAPETFYAGIRALQPGEMLEARVDSEELLYKVRAFHRWAIAPDPQLTLAHATDLADELVKVAVHRQMESEVPLGSLLSGGIDSSLVSAAAQSALSDELRTFNVRFSDEEYDETWAAVSVAKHIGSRHETLEMDKVHGTWDHVTDLLKQAGQPFADSSLFAVNAVCRLTRQHVSVALSGDGGDEGFGGYSLYWRMARITQLQKLPTPVLRGAVAALSLLSDFGMASPRFPQRVRDLTGADDTAVVQSMFIWLSDDEHSRLCREMNVLPVRRFFEKQWEHHLPPRASRLERLSMLATEANVRVMLPNDFLVKVDTASMKESLEVRVPMLDEDLFAFALSLPHHLKVKGHTGKRVLRRVAERKLPLEVARKPKMGFGIPVDRWVDESFRASLRDVLLSSSSKLQEFFCPKEYRPMVEAFCDRRPFPGVSRQGLCQRAVMLLSVELALA